MSRVDFYILPETTNKERFACAMTKKAWSAGNRVHLHTQSQESAKRMDELLWIFRDISFIPHEIYDGAVNEETPVTIGSDNSFPTSAEVMINLDNHLPEFVSRFKRIIEIVDADSTNKQFARERYKQYKHNDFETYDHKITTAVHDV